MNHYIGIDFSKKETHYCVLDEKGEKVRSGKVDTPLVKIRQAVEKQMSEAFVHVAIETGPLAFLISRQLRESGASVHVVNPYRNALIRQSTAKTDRLDAKQLAHQLWKENLPLRVYIPSEGCEDLRRLVSARARLISTRTALANRAIRLADRYQISNPRSAYTRWATWEKLADVSQQWKLVDRQMAEEYVAMSERVFPQIVQTEKAMVALAESLFPTEFKLLKTIPGFGTVTAAALLAYIEEIKRFHTARQLARYFGLTPAIRESSGHKSGGGICKEGNSRVRAYLVQAAIHAAQHKALQPWYENVRTRRGWKKARVAMARKLAYITFGVLTHGEPFDEKKIPKPA